ncbi:C25 family cysteine peptidase [Dyadobacter sp. CY327]|uniref:putative type IX secretion system sortase PorU2 n=1 Tax=Dyadobacter sp. CY327 TaxID=2907301 RepID=UPI001F351BFC|nr:C25 family cysteine peptidase [Dyadobacter sp. CY327]MCE7073337.1 C25 family cysteine peptidase [Dyadobacter sp. CY327]
MLDSISILAKTMTLAIVALLMQHAASAQWGPPYANGWIHYQKPYVKIGIAKKGIHRISLASLPKDFPTGSPDKLQLWRRGKQISILSANNKEVLFYALPNDGASDSLLYRPMNSRVNPYFSLYSDEGAYFLTVGDAQGDRAKSVEQPVDQRLPELTFHQEKVTTVYREDYTLSTLKYESTPPFLNSFFVNGASKTSRIQDRDGAGSITGNFELKNLASHAQLPNIKLLIHGRSNMEHHIEIYVGKNPKSLRLVNVLPISRFSPAAYSFDLKPGDTDAEGKGIISLKTTKADILNRFSLTYFSLNFQQSLQIDKQASKEFTLVPTPDPWSRVNIKGASQDFMFLEISDPDKPVIISGKKEGIMVPRQAGKTQVLLASKEIINVDAAKIKAVKLKPLSPKEANFIIITTDTLLESANQYADYRASQAGGSFKPLVMEIQEVYNQFNYGEPSPVAIRKMMSYMLTKGGKDKYLFLIGKSITHNEKMKRELPGEVPTIGYPGSDVLLVEGLAGAAKDVPAMPVGRLSAFIPRHVTDYLEKVKQYESKSTDYAWRKNVLHLNGGKTVGEITQLKGLLSILEPDVQNGQLGGKVKQYVKQQAMAEPEPVNIAADVNAGAGLITFFGHGSTYITDLDFGYITDAPRNYNNLRKYPMMYFNGCGVGNIFTGRSNQNPKTPKSDDRITLSLDWLLAADRGAIAIIANSFQSYVGPSAKYLRRLYHYMFTDPATVHLPIGKIQMAVARDIVTKDKDEYSIANVHQSLLQGDPALRLVTVDRPDYSVDQEESISLHSKSVSQSLESSDSLKVKVEMHNNGRFVAGQDVRVKVTYFGKQGNVVKTQMLKSFPAQDTLQVTFLNSKDIQKIQVHVDPDHLIEELNTSNNITELDIDWDIIKTKTTFSSGNTRDIVPPLLTVEFNDGLLQHKETISADPNVTVLLSDDRLLLPDTSLVEIFLKRCGDDNCDFEKVTYGENDIEITIKDTKSLRLSYATDLKAGTYEILVNAKDRAGNATAQPYRMLFEVVDNENPPTELVVSPNPTSVYLRFELKVAKNADLRAIRTVIYNQQGIVVEDKLITVLPGTLTNEWYWLPANPVPGLYVYKVFLINERNEPFATLPGKAIIHGK